MHITLPRMTMLTAVNVWFNRFHTTLKKGCLSPWLWHTWHFLWAPGWSCPVQFLGKQWREDDQRSPPPAECQLPKTQTHSWVREPILLWQGLTQNIVQSCIYFPYSQYRVTLLMLVYTVNTGYNIIMIQCRLLEKTKKYEKYKVFIKN